MTDRVHSLIVTLDNDIRVDDVECLIDAIKCLRHVLEVSPRVANHVTHMAEVRAKEELKAKLWEVLR